MKPAAALALLAGSASALAQTRQIEIPGWDGRIVARIPASGPDLPAPRPRPPAAGPTDNPWQQCTAPPGVYIRAISMTWGQTGFAAAEQGVVLRTTDGGNTWQTILSQGFPYYYYGVQAFSPQTVLITGFNNSANTGIFRWSDDGGQTWGPVITLPSGSPIPWAYFVKFADSSRGIIQAAIGIYYTTTGGRTAADWHFVEPTNNWFLGPFTFLPDGRAWMTGYDNFRSADNGAMWSPLPHASPVFDGPNSILPDGRGFIGGGSISPDVAGWVYSTETSGTTWSSMPVAQPPYPVRALLRLDARHAWAVGGNYFSSVGGIWSTSDGGTSWTLDQNTGAEMLDIEQIGIGGTTVDLFAAGEVSQIWRLRTRFDPACYANCDGSTVLPILNVNDFVCFINMYAANDPYANCDSSTIPPILNVNDFICFQNRYAQGCP